MAIQLTAQASAPGTTITKVEFYEGDYEKLGEVITPDGSGNYNLTFNLGADQYSFKAVLYTTDGAIESPVVIRTIYPSLPYVTNPVDMTTGVIDSGWNDISAKVIDNTLIGATPSSSDISGFWKARRDDNNLYLYIKILDDLLRKDGTGDFNDDSLEIYISPTRNTTSTYLATDRSFRIDASTLSGTPLEIRGNSTTNVVYKVVPIEGQYYCLLRVPLSNLGFNSTSNVPDDKVIGIEVQINDDDDGGNRDNKLAWFATSDNVFSNPANMGQAKLGVKPVAQTNTCTISSPSAGFTVERDTQIQIVAIATEYNTSISYIEFFANNLNIGQQSIRGGGNTYSLSYTASYVGAISLTAKSIYADGSFATSPAKIITVAEYNQIILTSPTNNSSIVLGSSIDIIATPNTSVGEIAEVNFYINTSISPDSPPKDNFITVNTPEGSGAYKTTLIPAEVGTYTVKAVATYDNGTTRASLINTFNVVNVPSGGGSGGNSSNIADNFNISGSRVITPVGGQFVAKGIRIPGLNSNSSRDITLDVDLIDKAWKFNAVVVDCKLIPDASSTTVNNDINKIINTFTSRGIITIIALNDLNGSYITDSTTPSLTTVSNFFKNLASSYLGNPYVWFNPFAEPGSLGAPSSQWITSHQAVIQTIRNEAGSQNIILCSGGANGQDLGAVGLDNLINSNSAILTYGHELKAFNGNSYRNVVYGLVISDQWVQNTATKLSSFISLCEQQNKPLFITSLKTNSGSTNISSVVEPSLTVAKSRLLSHFAASWEGLAGNTLTTLGNGAGYTINRLSGTKPTNLTSYGNATWDDLRDFTSVLTREEPTLPGVTGTVILNIISFRIIENNSAIGQSARAEIIVKNVGNSSSEPRHLAYTIYVRGVAVSTAGSFVSIGSYQTVTLISNPFTITRSLADLTIKQVS